MLPMTSVIVDYTSKRCF